MSCLDELYHYGIPGQKWGVRKKEEPTSVTRKRSGGKSEFVKFLKKTSAQAKENAMVRKQHREEVKQIKEKENTINEKINTASDLVSRLLFPIDLPGSGIARKPIKNLLNSYSNKIRKIGKKVNYLFRG